MTEYDAEDTGLRIRELRLKEKLKQSELADAIGVARNTLSQYESGDSKMSIPVLMKLSQELYTTTDFLLGLTDNPKSNAENRSG